MAKRIQKITLDGLSRRTLNFGFVGENLHTQIRINCAEIFWSYTEADYSIVVQSPVGELYNATISKDGADLIWDITASDLVHSGSGQFQLTFTNDGEIIRSTIGSFSVSASLEATGEAPTPLENWMEAAEETAHQMALDAANEAAEAVVESIPADYSEMSADVTELKSAFNSHFKPVNIISGFLDGAFSGSSLTIASRTNAVDLFFPVESGKKYTIVKPSATSYWRVGYSSSVPTVGTTLTDYNSSVSVSATYGTYTSPVNGYLCAYVYDHSDSANREVFKKNVFAYSGDYNSNYDVYTSKLVNVINVPENTGDVIDGINDTGILDDYLTVPNTKVSGYSINSDSGNFNVLSDSSYVEIPVVPGIKVSGYTRGGLDVNHGYAFYDSDGVFISGGNNIGAGTYDWNYNVTTPSNASIFRITCASNYINSFTANYSDVFGNTVKAVSSIQQTNVYYCGSNRTLNTLKKGIEEATKHMDAVLYVDPGTYDLVQEFGSAWFDALTSSNTMSGLVLKNRVHVIFAPNSKVISNYTGDNEYAQKLYSPFNAGQYGFTLENLTLECSRCRYAVHDERNGGSEQYKAHYINCNVYIDNSENDYWSSRACIGGGLGSNAEIIVENCVWKTDDVDERSGVYYHQSNDTSNTDYKSFVCIKECWFVTGCVQIDDARTGSTSGKTIYQVTGNSFLKKYINTNEQGIFVTNLTSPTSDLQAWNNVIRTT